MNALRLGLQRVSQARSHTNSPRPNINMLMLGLGLLYALYIISMLRWRHNFTQQVNFWTKTYILFTKTEYYYAVISSKHDSISLCHAVSKTSTELTCKY